LRKLVEFPLEEGGSVFVEAESLPGEAESLTGEVTRGMKPRELAGEASQTLEGALTRVQPAAVAIVSRLRALADAPEEIEVEFGIKLSAELGAFVAKASSDANFRVSLRWKRDSRPPG
jgi:hypothetical protein